MDEKERHERGMARRRKVLGNAWVDRANARRRRSTPSSRSSSPARLGRNLDAAAFRRAHPPLLVLGTMIALAQWDEFRLHVRAALAEGGFTQADIKEIILQQAIYCGVPAANHAFKEAAEVMAELAKSK